jgi:hypothetical protein
MQTIIQVFSTKTSSLRESIVKDGKLNDFGLGVTEQKKKSRAQGWAKLHMKGAHGAINIQWDADTRMLICRIVTKGGEPHSIASAFIGFLLARFTKRIAFIQILPK